MNTYTLVRPGALGTGRVYRFRTGSGWMHSPHGPLYYALTASQARRARQMLRRGYHATPGTVGRVVARTTGVCPCPLCQPGETV